MTGLETAGAIASVVTTVVTTATLIVLIWYTVETQRLRREAQRQNENSMMPIVVLGSVYVQGQQGGGANRPVIRNLGSGPAFNVYMDSITLLGKGIIFEHPRTLASGQEEYVAVSGTREAKQDTTGWYDDGKIHHTDNLLKVLDSSTEAVATRGAITYASATGKKYRTNFTMDHKRDAESFVVFDGMEAL